MNRVVQIQGNTLDGTSSDGNYHEDLDTGYTPVDERTQDLSQKLESTSPGVSEPMGRSSTDKALLIDDSDDTKTGVGMSRYRKDNDEDRFVDEKAIEMEISDDPGVSLCRPQHCSPLALCQEFFPQPVG
eukprot:m.1438390 g.1438390  ORF g.1438390 m.1438390 type:complete len:129 (+) comp25091_c0_seq5:265-651(+)